MGGDAPAEAGDRALYSQSNPPAGCAAAWLAGGRNAAGWRARRGGLVAGKAHLAVQRDAQQAAARTRDEGDRARGMPLAQQVDVQERDHHAESHEEDGADPVKVVEGACGALTQFGGVEVSEQRSEDAHQPFEHPLHC